MHLLLAAGKVTGTNLAKMPGAPPSWGSEQLSRVENRDGISLLTHTNLMTIFQFIFYKAGLAGSP